MVSHEKKNKKPILSGSLSHTLDIFSHGYRRPDRILSSCKLRYSYYIQQGQYQYSHCYLTYSDDVSSIG